MCKCEIDNRHFQWIFYIQRCSILLFDVSMKILGPLLILCAVVLIGGVAIAFFSTLLPMITTQFSAVWWFHAVFGLHLLFNIAWNYFSCVLTPAGTPATAPVAWRADAQLRRWADLVGERGFGIGGGGGGGGGGGDSDSGGERESAVLLEADRRAGAADGQAAGDSKRRSRWGSAPPRSRRAAHLRLTRNDWHRLRRHGFRWCRKCEEHKPPRAHHCHVSRKCILAMDHYCPWVNNCVGWGNYRYFFLFLAWLFTGCVYVVCLSAYPALVTSKRPEYRSQHVHLGSWPFSGGRGAAAHANQHQVLQFVFVIAASVALALFFLGGFHVFLILRGETTIEFYQNRTKAAHLRRRGVVFVNPYDLGRAKNWEQVFGPGSAASFGSVLISMLPSSRPPPPPHIPDLGPYEEELDRRRAEREADGDRRHGDAQSDDREGEVDHLDAGRFV